MFRLKFLLRVLVVINQGESSAPSTTKLCPETERYNTAFVRLVQSSKLLGQLSLGNIWSGRVKDIKDELATG